NECLPVRRHVFDSAQLRTIDCGIEHLGNNAPKDRKPQAAAAGIRRAYSVLVAMSPSGFDAGLAECGAFVALLFHTRPLPLRDSFTIPVERRTVLFLSLCKS